MKLGLYIAAIRSVVTCDVKANEQDELRMFERKVIKRITQYLKKTRDR